MNFAKQSASSRVTLSQVSLAYSMPMIVMPILFAQIHVLPGIYAEHFGLSLASMSLVILFAGIFDTVTDPLVGDWSDKVRARTGSRQAFIVVGLLLLLPCSWALFVPLTDAQGNASLVWYTFWFLGLYWAGTCLYIPHFALARDLTSSPDQRTWLFGTRRAALLVGTGVKYLIPTLPFFVSSKVTPETLKFSLYVAAALMLPALFLFLRYVPKGELTQLPMGRGNCPRQNPLLTLVSLLSNRPYRIYLAAQLFFGVGVGGFYGLQFIFVHSLLDLGEYYVYLKLLGVALALILVPLAVRLCSNIGKQYTYVIGVLTKALAFGFIILLLSGVDVSPLWVLLTIELLLAVTLALGDVSAPAYLADIVDYDALITRKDRTGAFYAVESFLQKVGMVSLGPALGLGIVGVFGFDPATPLQTEEIRQGFSIAMGWIPIATSMISGLLFWLIPLNSRRCAVVRRYLSERSRRIACQHNSSDPTL